MVSIFLYIAETGNFLPPLWKPQGNLMETKSLKALASKVLKRNHKGNSEETEKKIYGNLEGKKFPLKKQDEFEFLGVIESIPIAIKRFPFDDPYRNRYISIDDSPMFINFCTTHIRTDTGGFPYMAVIPLTLESATGIIRVFEWATFRVTDQNQMAGLYENDIVRIKGGNNV